jgi:hypothetical protein
VVQSGKLPAPRPGSFTQTLPQSRGFHFLQPLTLRPGFCGTKKGPEKRGRIHLKKGAGTKITRPVPGTRPSGSSLRDFMQNRSMCRDAQVSWSTWMCGNDPDDFVERVRIASIQSSVSTLSEAHFKKWCRHQDSNSGPTDYKIDARGNHSYP